MKSSWVRRNCLHNLHNDENGDKIGWIGKVKSQAPIWERDDPKTRPSGRSGKRKKYNARFNKGLQVIKANMAKKIIQVVW